MPGGIDDEKWRKASQADWDNLAAPPENAHMPRPHARDHLRILISNGTPKIATGVNLIVLSILVYFFTRSFLVSGALVVIGIAIIVNGWNREFKDSPGRYRRIRIRDEEM